VIRFGAIVSVVAVAIGLLIVGAISGALALVYISVGLAALALIMLIIGVAVWRDEVFGRPSATSQAEQSASWPAQPSAAWQAERSEAWHAEPPAARQPEAAADRAAEQAERVPSSHPAAGPEVAGSAGRAGAQQRHAEAERERSDAAAQRAARKTPSVTRTLPIGALPERDQPEDWDPRSRHGEPGERPPREPGPADRLPHSPERAEPFLPRPAASYPEFPDDPTRLAHRLGIGGQPDSSPASPASRARRAAPPPADRPRADPLAGSAAATPSSAHPLAGRTREETAVTPVPFAAPAGFGPAAPSADWPPSGGQPEVPGEPVGEPTRGSGQARSGAAESAPGIQEPVAPSPAGEAETKGSGASPPAAAAVTAAPSAADVAAAPVAELREAITRAAGTTEAPDATTRGARTDESTTADGATAGADAPAGAADIGVAADGPAASGDTSSTTDLDEVSVVPGIARYHRPDCILIRFLGEEDLQRMSRADAEATGCVPCKACRPEQPSASS